MPCFELSNMSKFWKSIAITLAIALAMQMSGHARAQSTPPTGIQSPITEFGAVGDGKTLNTTSIQKAIDQVASKGGGTVVVPEGVFLSGSVFLKAGVNLHLDKDAVIKGRRISRTTRR